MVVTIVGTHHYDQKGEERVKKILNSHQPEIIFVEGVENSEKFYKKIAKLEEEFYTKYVDNLPPKGKNIFETEMKQFKPGPENLVETIVNDDSKIIYLDDENYLKKRLEIYKKELDSVGKIISSMNRYTTSKKDDEETREYKTAHTIRAFSYLYPDEYYKLILQRPVDVDRILMNNYNLSKESAKEIEEEIRKIYSKPQNLVNSDFIGERDEKWYKIVKKTDPEDAVSFVGILHAIPEIENNFYNILKKDREVKFLPLIDADKISYNL
ncbi:MAG: hypothetical protein B6U88_00670 [Candidatus Aenigmarchaeota archaeon ex4484_56]|nr:MAG: hypothetical protein B6U88_00670 [Candidatus Aenigmarchaeota archaeon ex4484_56]